MIAYNIRHASSHCSTCCQHIEAMLSLGKYQEAICSLQWTRALQKSTSVAQGLSSTVCSSARLTSSNGDDAPFLCSFKAATQRWQFRSLQQRRLLSLSILTVLEATVTRPPTVPVATRLDNMKPSLSSQKLSRLIHTRCGLLLSSRNTGTRSCLTITASPDLEYLCATADNHRYQRASSQFQHLAISLAVYRF